MMILIGMMISFLMGATCMWLVYETKNAPELIEWHRIGRTFQERIKYRDVDEFISKN